jgi:hypothetical protein
VPQASTSTRRTPSKRPAASRTEVLGGDAGATGDELQGLGQGLRLLEDLLLHVVAVFAEFDRVGRQAGDVHRALDGAAVGADDAVAVAA